MSGNTNKVKIISFLILAILNWLPGSAQTPINRMAVVSRHNVVVRKIDSLSSLSVGNGRFAFTVDATGLQTFPESYQKGVPLGTLSEWCWDTFKDTVGYNLSEAYKEYHQQGRKVTYTVEWKEPKRKKMQHFGSGKTYTGCNSRILGSK